MLNGTRVAGVVRLLGAQQEKIAAAQTGEVVGLTRMEEIATGMVLTPSGKGAALPQPELLQPVYGLAVHAEKRGDDVKLTGSIAKLIDEDPTLQLEQNAELREMVLWGQGDVHLQIAIDRLRNRHNLTVVGHHAAVPYKETIRRAAQQHSRFKRQSGGHGQFADCTIDVKPLPRGSGFTFTDKVVGGAIPRNYIPAVEEGVVEALTHGPLGFPVVDLAVDLLTGQFHAVDSSDMAFKTAGRQAIQEALAEMRAGPPGADRLGRHLGAERFHRPRPAAHFGAARADPRLRRQARLAGLGRRQGAAAAQRIARSDRRIALPDPRRRQLRPPVRSHAGADRPAGRQGDQEPRPGSRAVASRAAVTPDRESVTWRRSSARPHRG